MNTTFKIVSAALLTGILSAAAVAAPSAHGVDGKHQERMMKKLSKKLDLSEEQNVSIAALKEQHGTDIAVLRERQKANRQAISESAAYDSYDADAIESLAVESGEITKQMTIMRTVHKHEFQALLTAEQREVLSEMKQNRSERRIERKQRKSSKRNAKTAS